MSGNIRQGGFSGRLPVLEGPELPSVGSRRSLCQHESEFPKNFKERLSWQTNQSRLPRLRRISLSSSSPNPPWERCCAPCKPKNCRIARSSSASSGTRKVFQEGRRVLKSRNDAATHGEC